MTPGITAITAHPTTIELTATMTTITISTSGLALHQEVALQPRTTAIAIPPAVQTAMTEAQARTPVTRGLRVVADQAKRL